MKEHKRKNGMRDAKEDIWGKKGTFPSYFKKEGTCAHGREFTLDPSENLKGIRSGSSRKARIQIKPCASE